MQKVSIYDSMMISWCNHVPNLIVVSKFSDHIEFQIAEHFWSKVSSEFGMPRQWRTLPASSRLDNLWEITMVDIWWVGHRSSSQEIELSHEKGRRKVWKSRGFRGIYSSSSPLEGEGFVFSESFNQIWRGDCNPCPLGSDGPHGQHSYITHAHQGGTHRLRGTCCWCRTFDLPLPP